LSETPGGPPAVFPGGGALSRSGREGGGRAGEGQGGGPFLCDTLARWAADPSALPSSPPDWPAETWASFREAAQVHGAAPLLWLRVRDLPSWSTAPIGPWLEDQYIWNGRRVDRLQGELAEVLRAFADADVPVLPVKGSVLGATIYEEPAARPMADLDVFLREEHFPAGEELLARIGYEKTFNGWKHARFKKPGSGQVVDREREHPDNPRQLEVHPRCRERILGEVVDLTDRIWAGARRGELFGIPTWLPGPDAAWLHLLIHATHHVMLNNSRLVQLVDLALLTPAVRDPAALLADLDARATYPALALLRRYFAIDLGEAVRSRVSPGFAAWADGLDLFSVCYLNHVPWRDGG
jgi:hypothetical protein